MRTDTQFRAELNRRVALMVARGLPKARAVEVATDQLLQEGDNVILDPKTRAGAK